MEPTIDVERVRNLSKLGCGVVQSRFCRHSPLSALHHHDQVIRMREVQKCAGRAHPAGPDRCRWIAAAPLYAPSGHAQPSRRSSSVGQFGHLLVDFVLGVQAALAAIGDETRNSRSSPRPRYKGRARSEFPVRVCVRPLRQDDHQALKAQLTIAASAVAFNAARPGYFACGPSSCSMRSNWLYLAVRSEARQ